MNKRLIAEFLTSVDVYSLPTSTYSYDEMDEFEANEMIEQAVKFTHDGQTMYVIPGIGTENGLPRLDCFMIIEGSFEDKSYDPVFLKKAPYKPTYEELSKILEEQNWRGAFYWLKKSKIEEVMKKLSKVEQS